MNAKLISPYLLLSETSPLSQNHPPPPKKQKTINLINPLTPLPLPNTSHKRAQTPPPYPTRSSRTPQTPAPPAPASPSRSATRPTRPASHTRARSPPRGCPPGWRPGGPAAARPTIGAAGRRRLAGWRGRC